METKDIIKKRRKELNLTLIAIAKRCNVSEATVSRWENGKIENIRKNNISSLAKILQVSPSSLLNLEEDADININELSKTMINNHKLYIRFILMVEGHILTDIEFENFYNIYLERNDVSNLLDNDLIRDILYTISNQ